MQNIIDDKNTLSTINSWVEEFSENMYSWALHKTSCKETAEDLVQETFLAAVQSFEKFEGKSQPKSWLYGILNNKIANHHRKNMKSPQISSTDNDLFNEGNGHWKLEQMPTNWHEGELHLLDNQDFKNTMQNCMEKLPTAWASAIQLKYLEEKKAEIICQELNLTVTNYWQILHRAKLQLRKCVDINWFKK